MTLRDCIATALAGGTAPRTRQQVLDDLARLDAENTLLDACVKR